MVQSARGGAQPRTARSRITAAQPLPRGPDAPGRPFVSVAKVSARLPPFIDPEASVAGIVVRAAPEKSSLTSPCDGPRRKAGSSSGGEQLTRTPRLSLNTARIVAIRFGDRNATENSGPARRVLRQGRCQLGSRLSDRDGRTVTNPQSDNEAPLSGGGAFPNRRENSPGSSWAAPAWAHILPWPHFPSIRVPSIRSGQRDHSLQRVGQAPRCCSTCYRRFRLSARWYLPSAAHQTARHPVSRALPW